MDKELEDLSYIIAKDLSEETLNILKKDLKSQKKLIKEIYKQLNGISESKKNNQNYTFILKNAYKVIMAAREFFTNEQITYRIYYSSSAGDKSISKKVDIYELNEDEILNLAFAEGTTLRLRGSFTKALKNAEHNLEREAIFEKHWQDIFNQLVRARWSKQAVYHVSRNIYIKYHKQNPNLKNSANQRYATFNRGNLYESFDATSEDIYSKTDNILEQINSLYNQNRMLFEKKYFGQYLKHDTIKGFQTGDVGLVQIKARRAQIIEISTLKKYLKEILDILELSDNQINQEKIIQKIKENFTNPEIKELEPELEKHIIEIAEKTLLKNIEKTLTN